jgi:hypothetical protein
MWLTIQDDMMRSTVLRSSNVLPYDVRTLGAPPFRQLNASIHCFLYLYRYCIRYLESGIITGNTRCVEVNLDGSGQTDVSDKNRLSIDWWHALCVLAKSPKYSKDDTFQMSLEVHKYYYYG